VIRVTHPPTEIWKKKLQARAGKRASQSWPKLAQESQKSYKSHFLKRLKKHQTTKGRGGEFQKINTFLWRSTKTENTFTFLKRVVKMLLPE
jgi:hypothetical protein